MVKCQASPGRFNRRESAPVSREGNTAEGWSQVMFVLGAHVRSLVINGGFGGNRDVL